MKAAKTETITVRIEPAVKAGLKAMAERERRSLGQYDRGDDPITAGATA